MKLRRLLPILLMASASAMAFDVVWMKTVSGSYKGIEKDKVDNIAYSSDYSELNISLKDGETLALPTSDVSQSTFGESEGIIEIVFDNENTEVYNPFAFETVTTEIVNGVVVLRAATGVDVKCNISGTTASGGLKIYGDGKVAMTLNDANITNPNGAAINVQAGKTEITLKGASTLTDGAEYQTPEGEKEKGCVYSVKALTIKGSGTLNVFSNFKHGIVTDKKLSVNKGNIVIKSSASDGLHGDGVEVSGGKISTANTQGDGIDADKGEFVMTGGEVEINIATADTKAIKADADITISGGTIDIVNSADQGKAIKSKANIRISGGTINAVASGNAVIVENDPSYCTIIKADANFTMSGGEITIDHTGKGGKGISVDGDATFNGGKININCKGNGDVYTNLQNVNDAYSSTCISVDGNLDIKAGEFILNNSGSAGKCIKCDMVTTIGDAENGPSIEAHTTGARILESQGSSTGNSGWGRPGGGFDNNADYSNPKALKSEGELIINNGNLTITTAQTGGEGLESKSQLTINGGVIDVKATDDGLNAANHIQINGGVLHVISTNNDAIDSNGTLTIAGGVVIAIGANTPECAFDCDNNRFAITGGVLFGLAGDTSSPTTSACTQRTVIYSKSLSTNQVITVKDPSGKNIVSFKKPQVTTGSKMVISSPEFASNTTYTILTDAAITGGEENFELTVGGTCSGGAQATTFTPTSMVTTIGGSSRPR